MKKIIFALFFFIFFLSFISAGSYFGVFKQGENIELYQHCDDATYINISSISYPNSSIAISDVEMNAVSGSGFEYDFNKTSVPGIYDVRGYSDGCDEQFLMRFEVTPTGKIFSEGQSIGGIVIIIGIITAAIIFMLLGFKFANDEGTIPLAIFFIIFSLIFVVYGLNLGYAFANDVLEYQTITGVQGTIFTVTLFSLVGLAIISMILMFASFLRRLSTIKKVKSFGNDFDPITKTYKY